MFKQPKAMVGLAVIIVVGLGFVSVSALSGGQAQREVSIVDAEDEKIEDGVDGDVEETQETEEVEQKEEASESVSEVAGVTTQTTSTQAATQTTTTQDAPVQSSEPQELMFVKGGQGQEGQNIHVSATMNAASSGTCTYHFHRNGTLRPDSTPAVWKTTRINNGKTCEVYVPVSEFPISDIYWFTVTFRGDNPQQIAEQGPTNVTVKRANDPVALEFRKGGHTQEGDQVHVSATMNAASSGKCIYTFYPSSVVYEHPDSVAVRRTNTISNSKTCNIYIPVSAFPGSDTYWFTIDFVSSDNLRTATQGRSDIEVAL